MSKPARHFYEFGPFRLDPAEHLLLRDDKPVQLTPKAFETLLVLVKNRGHVLEKDELIKKVWPDTLVEEIGLARNISVLRKALGEGPAEHQYIETVSKLGYRFVAEVTEVLVESADVDKDEHTRARPITEEEPSARPDQAITSLAVLPFTNASADPGMYYLSDGITESLINSLSQLPQLRVMARSTVFRYKGRDDDPQSVGRQLGVRAVLVGRVLQVDDQLIVSTELVDVARGWQLWGEQYNRKVADIFVVQAEITREIAEKLRLRLSGEEQRRLAKRYTENTEAYQCYLRGRYFWNKRTEEGIRKGIGYFQQAIEIDPAYALAYAGLADSYLIPGIYRLPPREVFPRAMAAARKALEIDETLAEAHTSLAFLLMLYDWDWEGAERGFQRAIELRANYPIAHLWYGLQLMAMGRFDESLAEMRRAQELDPLSLIINVNLGGVLYRARQYDEGIEQCLKTLEIDPNFFPAYFHLGLAYNQKGMYEEAIAALQKARGLDDTPAILGVLGHVYAAAGRHCEARKIIDELKELARRRYVLPCNIAIIHAALGERDEALEWLEKGYEDRDVWLVLKVDPVFDGLRSDPRFRDLIRRIGLAP